MEFIKRNWWIFVLLAIAIYFFAQYGWLKFMGVKGSACNNPDVQAVGGRYQYGQCKVI